MFYNITDFIIEFLEFSWSVYKNMKQKEVGKQGT